ncbi:MAG: right-handed parallel beta-helix repeat-containing protein, partial [Sedimentisphaerales bacterium]|nr:right-handed parallel beta-helix repeat-containing protein [Sedimentisphaerales bacterium]
MFGLKTRYLLPLALCAILAQSAAGRVIYVDDDATLPGDGSGWEKAYACLQNALEAAQPGDKIRAAQGTYKPDQRVVAGDRQFIIQASGDRAATFALKSGVELRGGYAGIGAADPNARDIKLYETILSGDLEGNDLPHPQGLDLIRHASRQDNSGHVVTVESDVSGALLEGFTITAGNAFRGNGGGIDQRGDVTVRRCTFARNASYFGGAVWGWGPGVDFTDCIFLENLARGGGAAVHISSGQSEYSFANCYFAANYGYDDGATVENSYGSGARFDNCVFVGCRTESSYKGVIHNFASDVTITGCSFAGNYPHTVSCPPLSYGEPIPSEVRLTNCILYDETALSSFYPAGDSRFTVNNCNVKGGFAGAGNIDADPLFADADGPDGSFGTLDDDLRLLPGSPCINAGDNSAVDTATDMAGGPRITEGTVDMGAYEQWVIVEPNRLRIDEGQSGQFTVKLTRDPGATLEINLSLQSANPSLPLDGDIIITSDAVLTFDSSNFDQPQPVSIAAAEDDDMFDDSAVVCLSAPGSIFPLANVAISVSDDEADPSVSVLHVDSIAPDGGDGSSWIKAFNSLQDALAIARQPNEVRLIKVAGGVYKPDHGLNIVPGDQSAVFELPTGCMLEGGYAGITLRDPNLRNPNLRDVRSYKTALSGDLEGNDERDLDGEDEYDHWSLAENSIQVVLVGNAEAGDTNEVSVLDGVTIIGARSEGLFASGGRVNSINCDFVRNRPGGGARLFQCDSEFTNCTFESNGRGLWSNFGNLTVTDCNFTCNQGWTLSGAGLSHSDGSAVLTNCNFDFNISYEDEARGGGAAFYRSDVIVSNCRFMENRLDDEGDGGGIFLRYCSQVAITDCEFLANYAGDRAGALAAYFTTSTTVQGCSFVGNSALEDGAAIYQWGGQLELADCYFSENFVVQQENQNGIDINKSYGPPDMTPIIPILKLDDCTFDDSGGISLISHGAAVELLSDIHLSADTWSMSGDASIEGPGSLYLDVDSSLIIAYDPFSEPEKQKGNLLCDVRGEGVIVVPSDYGMIIGGDAHIQVSRIQCDGLLRIRDRAIIDGTAINVTRLSFEGDIGIYNSVITAEAGSPFGQFFIEDTASIIGNDIHADGDRYMDLDPTVFQGLIANNRIFVTITEGVGHTRGGLFELRGTPDLAGPGTPDPNNPFFCQVPAVPGFDPTTWTLEELRLVDNAKVNLTNRFDFQPPYDEGGEDEVLYVRNLYLGAGSVLNTSFNKIYYENLYADPCSVAENVPLLGFSLNNIAFDDHVEFAARVTYRTFRHPSNPYYDRVYIERVEGLAPDLNGMMRMSNLRDEDPNSATHNQLFNARAKGLFARANEDLLLITFEYLFETDDPDVELVVYLTDIPELMAHDDPNRPDHYIEIARLAPPPLSRPGSLGSGRFGVFYAYVERGRLDFLRGTRIELELIGPHGSSVL